MSFSRDLYSGRRSGHWRHSIFSTPEVQTRDRDTSLLRALRFYVANSLLFTSIRSRPDTERVQRPCSPDPLRGASSAYDGRLQTRSHLSPRNSPNEHASIRPRRPHLKANCNRTPRGHHRHQHHFSSVTLAGKPSQSSNHDLTYPCHPPPPIPLLPPNNRHSSHRRETMFPPPSSPSHRPSPRPSKSPSPWRGCCPT